MHSIDALHIHTDDSNPKKNDKTKENIKNIPTISSTKDVCTVISEVNYDLPRGISYGAKIGIGTMHMQAGKQFRQMIDITQVKDGIKQLQETLKSEGYLVLRNVIKREDIIKARRVVCKTLQEFHKINIDGHNLIDAFIKDKEKGSLYTGYTPITHHSDVLNVLEGKEICDLMSSIYQGDASTFNTKWCRVFGTGECTDEHTDFYRFASCAKDMLTAWIPLGDYDVKDGVLAVLEGSHNFPGYKAKYYNQESKSELPSEFYKQQKNAIWRSSHFNMGDIVIFDIRLIHASTINEGNSFRISIDTRWQPSINVPKKSSNSFTAFPYIKNPPQEIKNGIKKIK